MKKRCFVWMLLVVLLCLLPLEGLATRWGNVVRITNSNAVNVRSGPGTGYRVLGEVQPENLYVYLGEEDGWNCILYQNQPGYVSANRTTIEDGLVPDEYGWGDCVDAVVRVTHYNALNVRGGPGKKYSTLGQAKPDSTWQYLGMDDGWYIIAYGNKTGYIAANRTAIEILGTYPAPEGTSGATAEAASPSVPEAESSATPAAVCEYCGGTGKLTIQELDAKIDCFFCQ